jgi:phospholipase/carboxylesterase
MVVGRSARRAAAAAVVVAGIGALVVLRPWSTRLEKIEAGGKGPPTFVLLHGYGSSPERWMPFTTSIAFSIGGRFVFPRGPETTVPPDGPLDGRAWWRIDLASYIQPGRKLPDLSAAQPPGLERSAALVHTLLRDLSWSPGGRVVLGGFSQGAMVASQLAFESNDDLAALVLLSGTIVDERTWRRDYSRRRGLPVFVSHGRRDDILPFEAADRFRRELEAAGLRVTWVPFDGGHDVPEEVVVALNAFLKDVGLGR